MVCEGKKWQLINIFVIDFFFRIYQIVSKHCWSNNFGLRKWITRHFFGLSGRQSIKAGIGTRGPFWGRRFRHNGSCRSRLPIDPIYVDVEAFFEGRDFLHGGRILGILHFLQVYYVKVK